MQVAIVGSRDWPKQSYTHILNLIQGFPTDTVVVSGGARGVDRVAAEYALACGLQVLEFKAQWVGADGRFNRGAGMNRNTDIIREAELVCAFWDYKSRGTLDSIRKAANAGKHITVIAPDGSRATAVYKATSDGVVYSLGDLLLSNADAIVNPCNMEGVMGAGVSKQIADRWPGVEHDYKELCQQGALSFRSVACSLRPSTPGMRRRKVVHVPTQDRWREASKVENIDTVLQALRTLLSGGKLTSLALPHLGSGLGGLDWNSQVRLLVHKHLGNCGVPIIVVSPLDYDPLTGKQGSIYG